MTALQFVAMPGSAPHSGRDSVYQFKVSLLEVSPQVSRRLLLRSDQSLADLHYAIQIAMDWSNQHLHRFHIHGKNYAVPVIGGLGYPSAHSVSLSSFKFRLRERFVYEYDFYDFWMHEVRLEKRLPLDARKFYPFCAGGSHRSPPEDCGGARA
jgi:hypothetical protein